MKNSLLLFIIIILATVGCDKQCSRSAENVYRVNNLTNRDLDLVFCKGFFNVKQEVSMTYQQNGLVTIGTTKSSYIQGGLETLKSCDQKKMETVPEKVALSNQSFNEVKLCYSIYDDTSLTIVETNNQCPQNTIQQQAPGNCDL